MTRPLLRPVATLPVELTAVRPLEPDEQDRPWLLSGHHAGSVLYFVYETDNDGLHVQTFTVDGDYSVEIRAVPR
jgi:hypothetical protein